MKKVFVLVLAVLFTSVICYASMSKFMNSWNFYRKRVGAGASLSERRSILTRILAKYKDSGIDLTIVEAEKNYITSWMFYNKQKRAGATPAQRKSILTRILNKYNNAGVDLSIVRAEFDNIVAKEETIASQEPEQVEETQEASEEAAESEEEEEEEYEEDEEEYEEDEEEAEEEQKAKKKKKEKSEEEDEELEYKTFGLGLRNSGGLGTLGYHANINFNEKWSMMIGYGTYEVSAGAGTVKTRESITNMLGLVRYGGKLYYGIGLHQLSATAEASIGSTKASVSLSAMGIPIVFGLETGSKNGFFFNLEAGYVYYTGDSDKQTALVTVGSSSARMAIDPSASGLWYGIGLGWYIF